MTCVAEPTRLKLQSPMFTHDVGERLPLPAAQSLETAKWLAAFAAGACGRKWPLTASIADGRRGSFVGLSSRAFRGMAQQKLTHNGSGTAYIALLHKTVLAQRYARVRFSAWRA